jgi:uncharacterized membrane protein YfcA
MNPLQKKPMTIQILITIIIIGLSAGILSGLVGVGGGIILVPAMVMFLHYGQHQAQGTSLAVLTLPVVILASLKYYTESKSMGTPIDLKVVGLLALGFLGGGYIGSYFALKIDESTLKKIFAIILFYTAFRMIGWEAAVVKWVRNLFN